VRKRRSVLATVLLFQVWPLFLMSAVPSVKEYRSSSQSSVKVSKDGKGVIHRTTVNSRYRFVNATVGPRNVPEEILLHEIIENSEQNDREGSEAKVTANAYRLKDGVSAEPLWALTDNSDMAELWGDEVLPDFYKTTLYGCCGAENLYRFYSLSSGTLVMLGSLESPAMLGTTKEARVAVSYWSAEACLVPPEIKSHKDSIGLLTLYAKDVAVCKSLVFSDTTGSRTPSIELFPEQVQLSYGEGLVITIPLLQGQFDAQHISPKGIIRLQPLPCGK
jgi:hypothetical protein